MEQRRLRLGDILDDYCPRERRITNHAVVAMIEEDVKQTRCTTCDAEHAYKGGQAPRKRKKESTATLYKEVLSGMTDNPAPVPSEPTPAEPPGDMLSAADTNHDERVSEAEAPGPEYDSEPPVPAADEGPVHRPLIRATLPRPEGQKDARPVPEFTIRYPGNRGNGQYRDGRMRQRAGGGARVQSGQRFASPRGNGRGPTGGRTGGGFRGMQNQRHGGKKRSR